MSRQGLSRRDFLKFSSSAIAGLVLSGFEKEQLYDRRVLPTLPALLPDAPNVLFIVLDTVRAKSMSLYGYPRPTTPNLEALAASGVLFMNAFAPAPWTLPSHASMFTGQFPHRLNVDWTIPLDTTFPTLAEVLASQGYQTAGFIANTEYCSSEFGLNRGFSHYEDYPINLEGILTSPSLVKFFAKELRKSFGNNQLIGRKSAERINQDFLSWLSKQHGDRPFFAFLNYYDAHDPYISPREFALKFSAQASKGVLDDKKGRLSKQEIKQLNDAYDGSLGYLDHYIGQLIKELSNKDLLKNTLVIIVSDHGEQFGEHGLVSHANSLYMPVLHVPLIVFWQDQIPAGFQVREPVNLRNIAATIADLTGIGDSRIFPGQSLAANWSNPSSSILIDEPVLSEVTQGIRLPDWYPNANGPLKSLVTGGIHYIFTEAGGQEELYDLEKDPEEQNNLANLEAYREVLLRFRKSLGLLLNHG